MFMWNISFISHKYAIIIQTGKKLQINYMNTHYVYENVKFRFYLYREDGTRHIVYVHEQAYRTWMNCFRQNYFEFDDIDQVFDMRDINAELLVEHVCSIFEGPREMDTIAEDLAARNRAIFDRSRMKSSEFIEKVQHIVYMKEYEMYNKVKKMHDRVRKINEKIEYLKAMYRKGIIEDKPRWVMLTDSYYKGVTSGNGINIREAKAILFFHKDLVMGESIKLINE